MKPDDAVSLDYDEAVAEEPTRRQLRWKPITAAVIAAAVLAGGVGLLVTSDPERQITGTPVAKAVEVVKYADEVEAQAIIDQAAAEEAWLASLETQVKQSLQDYFDDPATALYLPITVGEVALIRTSDNTYEGTATMQAEGYSAHQILIHVTADERNVMWQTDPGALLPLFLN